MVSFRGVIRAIVEPRGSIKTMPMGSFLGYFVGILPVAVDRMDRMSMLDMVQGA
jgi:hypothetical protein